MNKTDVAKKKDITKKWYVVDATDKVLGRLASDTAMVLMGKNKPIWTPNVDTGDFVIIINADKIRVTGRKLTDKIYYKHTGYIGGLKEETLLSMKNRKPEFVITHAVKGMLPKTKLGRQMLKKLNVYKGDKHPHQAQSPEPLELGV
ncbi:50S ribosomal protein L13 [bacterium]|nr:50S ribosomal protein L13 [bacterium]